VVDSSSVFTQVALTVLLIVAFFMLFLVWKRRTPEDRDADRIHREMLENLRRELSETKDKLHEGMGKSAESVQQRLEKTLELVNKQLSGMDSRIDKRVQEMNQRLDTAAKLLGLVQRQYGTVEQLSGDIRRLQEAFKSPKPRGGFGEQSLADLVAQVLPVQSFATQQRFRNGVIVDLLIQTANGSIPVDAKFPMENFLKLAENPKDDAAVKAFQRDVKGHVLAVGKYIRPEEGTIGFALMYVPSDAVMYEILADRELSSYAQSKNVLILSPHSFFYFLKIIYLSYQSQKFEENARQVLDLIRGVKQQSERLGDHLGKLETHLKNAQGQMSEVGTDYDRLNRQIDAASSVSLEQPRQQRALSSVEVREGELILERK
jgi:DNA recombination protein RmuC